MKVKLIIISIILLLVMVFACGCIPFMEKLGILTPPEEEQLSPEKGGPPDGLVKVLIGFKQKPGSAEQALVTGSGGEIKYTYNLIPAIAASVPEVAIDALKKNPNITNVELDSMVYALDDELENSWGVKHIGAGFVHDDGNKGAGIKVAIIDTGIDYNHPDLDANYKDGYDFVNSDDDPMDDEGHGTHVAGIIAAEDNNIGVVGVAPAAELYAIKVLDDTGSGYVSDVILAIQWATDPNGNGYAEDRLDIINMSLGAKKGNIFLKWACNLAYNDGLLLVAAAGNEYGGAVIYPAAYDSVIAVSATNSSDGLASFSSVGLEVELAAPGVNINSTLPGNEYSGETWSGTSMASPHVAGTAALVWAANPGWSNEEVRIQLRDTADDLGATGWDSKYGYGLVDADEAAGVVETPLDTEAPVITGATGNTTGTTGESVTISATITDNVGVANATVYYTPIGGTETTVAMAKAPETNIWKADVPVASNKVGTITYYLKTKDAANNEARNPSTGSYTITVIDNDSPIANAGPDRSVLVNTIVTLDGSGSTDNIGIISYKWDFDATDGVNWDTSNATGVTATTIYSAIGTYTVTLQASDAAGLTATDTAVITVTKTPLEVTVFEDSFEVSEWNGLWTEDSQNDWFRSTQRAINGTYSAEVDGRASNARLISIPIDLQGRTNATITFSWYIESSLDKGEYLAFDVSTDGGNTWVEKATLKGNIDSEDTWHSVVSIDLVGISNLKIQFRGKMSGSDEDANVDLVKVIGW
ncbi:MAG: S8 family serine peptidase [Candidatus Atribacteria bacterium]|nr:S8 family serine peptidase [Candidatus Atribacteria bacterium]